MVPSLCSLIAVTMEMYLLALAPWAEQHKLPNVPK
jgi:hypothetical protein